MEELNSHEKLIIDILKDSKKLDSGELFKAFLELSEKQGLEKIVDRTFRKYMDSLVRHGLINSSGEGRWRTYSLAEQPK